MVFEILNISKLLSLFSYFACKISFFDCTYQNLDSGLLVNLNYVQNYRIRLAFMLWIVSSSTD